MSWLAGFGAAVVMFFGSIFSFAAHAPAPTLPQTLPATQATLPAQTPAPTALPQTQNYSRQPPAPTAPLISPQMQQIMQEIGCSDMSSCIAACTKLGMTSACAQLQETMSAQMSQGRTSAAYTVGVPSGPMAPPNGVAFVGNNTPTSAAGLPDCPSDTDALLDTSPIATADLSGIEPLGHMNGEHILPNQADHVYLNTTEGSAPVYSPGNVTLLAVAKTTGIAGADTGANSVKLFFSPCKSLMFALQINTLSPQLEQALSGMHPSVQNGATVQNETYGNLKIALTSGEQIGTVVTTNGVGGADFAAADVRTPVLKFIDSNEVTGMLADSYQHAVCPLDYFNSPLRSTLEGDLTIQNAGSNGIPACGSVMQDKVGTSQGNWYDKSGPAPSYQGIDEGALLAIAHWNLDPSQGVVSVGTDLIPSQWLGTQLVFTPQSGGFVDREPGQITPDGNVYCFNGPAGAGGRGPESHIDIKLSSASTLEADYGSGDCAQIPTLSSNTVTYSR